MRITIIVFALFLLITKVNAQNTNARSSSSEVQNSKANSSVILQEAINPWSGEPLSVEKEKSQKISGKVISIDKEDGLNVPNLALFQTNDGLTHFISSDKKSFRVGEKLNLDGYFQNTYYNSVKNIANVFYVTKIITSETSGKVKKFKK